MKQKSCPLNNRFVDLDLVLKIATYIGLIAIISVALWASNGQLNGVTVGVILIWVGYTLILVLPFSKFKLGPWGFEGELARLGSTIGEQEIPPEVDERATRKVEKISQATIDPRVILLELSVEIERNLRRIAETTYLKKGRGFYSLGQLIQVLRKREIITDSWLINALEFFNKRRIELVHRGSVSHIYDAIGVGREVLARLDLILSKY